MNKELLIQALDEILNSTPTPLANDCEYADGSWQLRREVIKNLEAAITQPVLPTMQDALDAGDGTLHGAIDYWQAKCAEFEAKLVQMTQPVVMSKAHITWNAEGVRTVNGIPDYVVQPVQLKETK